MKYSIRTIANRILCAIEKYCITSSLQKQSVLERKSEMTWRRPRVAHICVPQQRCLIWPLTGVLHLHQSALAGLASPGA